MNATLRKWDFEKHKYETVENVYCVELMPPILSKIQCVNCGKEMLCGDSYTSYQWQDEIGFGYRICPTCYEAELAQRGMPWVRLGSQHSEYES